MPSIRHELQTYSDAIITGASSGIGKSLATQLRANAPHLQIHNLSRTQPDAPEIHHHSCDLSDPAQLQAAAENILSILDKLPPNSDVAQPPAHDNPPSSSSSPFTHTSLPFATDGKILLINNSGFGAYGDYPAPDLPHNLAMLDLNIRAILHLTGILLPALKQRGGAIINIASTAAFQPTPHMATYGATKTFVLHWTLALDAELRASTNNKLRALAICPGPTSTNFFRRAGLKQGTVPDLFSQSSDTVARDILRALAAKKSLRTPALKNRLVATLARLLPLRLVTPLASKILAATRLQKNQTSQSAPKQ